MAGLREGRVKIHNVKMVKTEVARGPLVEAPLNFVEIKNPLGPFQTNPQAKAWWVVLLILWKKVFFLKYPSEHHHTGLHHNIG